MTIPLVFAESSENFDRLAGNQPRNCEDFYPLIPELPPAYVSTNSKITPLFAVQVTLFPNSGIAIGCTSLHVIGDANVVVGFTRAWASINKFDGDSQLLASNSLPFYDRSVIKDPYNLRTRIFNHIELVSKDGFLIASELIGAAIHKAVNDKEGILNGSGLFNLDGINWKKVIGVTGTPKYDTYDADFGWGKPEKYESVSIDIDGAMSLNKSGREENGLEVGLSIPEEKMKAFGRIFTSELGNL